MAGRRAWSGGMDVRKGAGNFLRGVTPSQDMMAVVYDLRRTGWELEWLFGG